MSERFVRRYFIFLTALAAGFVWESPAHAQFAGLVPEYDWTVTTDDYRFGIYQSLHYPEGWRRTDIHWGGGAIGFEGGFARTIAVATGGTLVTFVILVVSVLAWPRSPKSTTPAS